MNYITRIILNRIKQRIKPNKVIILLGARRVGKTVLLKAIANEFEENEVLFLNGEDQFTVNQLSNKSVSNYQRLLGSKKYLIIDEAQHISGIGRILKLMVDEIDGIHIIVTGSSVFDLGNQLGEPLVGRQISFQLFPIAQMELSVDENIIKTHSSL